MGEMKLARSRVAGGSLMSRQRYVYILPKGDEIGGKKNRLIASLRNQIYQSDNGVSSLAVLRLPILL